MPCHINDFCIHSRVCIAYSFAAELLMLPVSSCLRSLISKNGTKIIKPYWLGQVVHPVLDIGPTDWRCALRAQGHFHTTVILEGIHLFLYNISPLTHAMVKKPCLLKDRGINTLISIELTNLARLFFHKSPVSLFLGQDVCGTSWCLIQLKSPC
jgi:hypothetical protein